jgi:hypothetical protein
MYARDLGQQSAGEGLNRMEAEFITSNLTVHAEVTSPETRMSDFLNGSSRSIEVQPLRVRTRSGAVLDLSQTMAGLTKAQILMAIPIFEPESTERAEGAGLSWYLKYRCRAVVGQYSIAGNVHAENYRDPRLLLRALEQRQFLPLSDAEITYTDGTTVQRSTVILNRWHLELLSVPKPRW